MFGDLPGRGDGAEPEPVLAYVIETLDRGVLAAYLAVTSANGLPRGDASLLGGKSKSGKRSTEVFGGIDDILKSLIICYYRTLYINLYIKETINYCDT